MVKQIVLILLLCGPVLAVNQIENDAACVFLYNFETGALTTDTASTNTLTNSGVSEEAVLYKQGSVCGHWTSGESDYMVILDSALTSDCSIKYGYGSPIAFTIGFWARFDTLPGGSGYDLFSKYYHSDGKKTVKISLNTDDQIAMAIGYNNGLDNETATHASALSADTWYHIVCTYDNADKSYRIRIHDESDVVGSDATGTLTLDANKIVLSQEELTIGAYNSGASNYLNGYLDEMYMTNDVMTSDEIDQVWAGTYPDILNETTYYVNTDDTTGPHDGSITNPWEDLKQALAYFAGASQDPISLNEAVTILCYGTAADANVPIAPGEIETDTDNYIIIQGDKTGAAWNTGQYRIVGADCMLLTLDSNDLYLTNIQMQLTSEDGAGDGCLTVTTPGATNHVEITNCIFRGDNVDDQDDIAVTSTDTGTHLYWYNNVVYEIADLVNGADLLANCKVYFPNSQTGGSAGVSLGGFLQE